MSLNETSKLEKQMDDLDQFILNGGESKPESELTLTGTLTRDPNLRHLPNGTFTCDFGVEIAEPSWDPHPTFLIQGIELERFRCKAYGQTAEIINKYYRKGREIIITGDIWEIQPVQVTEKLRYDQTVVFVNEVKLSEIQQVCHERDIKSLCHFTRGDRLRSILLKGRGLLSRIFLETLPAKYRPPFTDQDRGDGFKEAICLSISFSNYRMFYSKTGPSNQHKWVVLLLDVRVLWELDCAFCHQNARFEPVLRVPLEERKRLILLERMFWLSDSHPDGSTTYQRQQIPDNYPTHPEAEVLVFDSIPAEYIKEVHFYDRTALTTWQQENPGTYSQRFCANEHYFKYRCDYKAW